MALDLPGIKNIFPHSKEFSQGLSKRRIGAGTVVVSLDGTGDFDSIQEAINFLPKSGGEVFVKEGTYIQKKITINKDNVKLTGTGDGTILEALATESITINCTSSNLKINNFKINLKATNQIGIQFNNGKTNMLAENIHFFGLSATYTNSKGIHVDGSVSDTKILNCFFDDMGGDAIAPSGDNNIISNCTINVAENGIRTDGLTNSSIVGNTIRNCTAQGIVLSDDNNTSDNNTCIGNTCSSNVNGIRIFGDCDENVISSNQCNSNSNDGILVEVTGIRVPDKNILIGNICLNNSNAAITDGGTNTHPNGASGTTNLTLDDLNIIA